MAKEAEWPEVSSPRAPPLCNFYFDRMIGDTRQGEVRCTGFRTFWQLGVYVRSFLADGALISCEDKENESELVYEVVLERDADGNPIRTRRFWARINGCTYQQAMKVSEGKSPEELPWSVDQWRRQARGEAGVAKVNVAAAPTKPDIDRPAREPKAPKAPRASRDGMITVASMCEEAGVEPSKVRDLLRKRKVAKPDSGWAYAKGDPALGTIADVIAAVKRGDKK